MARIHRQRRLCPHAGPATPKWQGPPSVPRSPLSLAERAVRKLPAEARRPTLNLLRVLELRAPGLLVSPNLRGLARLARLPFVRPLDQLPESTSVREVVDGLLARYPLPPWAHHAFTSPERLLDRFAEVAAALGRGEGYETASCLLYGELNRRIFANFLVAEGAPMLALRRAQVAAFGGPAALAERLTLHRAWAEPRGRLDELAWLCRHAVPDEVGHVLDWSLATGTPLVGRTWPAAVRATAEWRTPRPRPTVGPIPASGIPRVLAGTWVAHGPEGEPRGWHVVELRSGAELVAEGARLRHCVATYAPMAAVGTVSLWSLRLNGEPKLTIEVRNAPRLVVQVRGFANRRPAPEEQALLLAWAGAAGLAVAPSACR